MQFVSDLVINDSTEAERGNRTMMQLALPLWYVVYVFLYVKYVYRMYFEIVR